MHERSAEHFEYSRVSVWGEVLSVRRSRGYVYYVLGDKDELCSFEAKISTDKKRTAKVGDYVQIPGVLQTESDRRNGMLSVVLCGDRIAGTKPPRRVLELQRQVRDLRGAGSPMELPRQSTVRKVSIVAGRTSVARRDFERAMKRRYRRGGRPADWVTLDPAPVFLRSPEDVARGIREAAISDCDLVVVTRGGGDPLDMLVFDHPAVVEALAWAGSRRPVVLAVGHAPDTLEAACLVAAEYDVPADAGNEVGWLACPEPTPRAVESSPQRVAAVDRLMPAAAAAAPHRPHPMEAKPVTQPAAAARPAPARPAKGRGWLGIAVVGVVALLVGFGGGWLVGRDGRSASPRGAAARSIPPERPRGAVDAGTDATVTKPARKARKPKRRRRSPRRNPR